MTNVKQQPTRPNLRQRQAQATRDLIVSAAQELFLEQGYTGTTIEAIAEKAEVAGSTVYAVFGSKRAILRAIREAWHGQSHIRDTVFDMPPEAGADERLERFTQATRRQWEGGTAVISIYNGAAAADPEAAAELAQALQGRHRGMQAFAEGMVPYLRPGLEVPRATAVIQALCLPEVYDDLVRKSGWTADAYQAWLLQALRRELLNK